MRRRGFSLRRKTTTAQKDPFYMVDRIVAYVMQIHRIEKQFSFHNADIIALYTIHLPGMIWSPTPLLRKMVQKKSP